jgi:hypothetical protein
MVPAAIGMKPDSRITIHFDREPAAVGGARGTPRLPAAFAFEPLGNVGLWRHGDWKGYLKLSLVPCTVELFAAAARSGRTALPPGARPPSMRAES